MRNTIISITVLLALLIAGSFANAQTPALTPAQCLLQVQKMKVQLPQIIGAAKDAIHRVIQDPAAYEKTLPPLQKVIDSKDVLNLKNYGGLAEAYYFSENSEKGESIYAPFSKSANMLGPKDNFFAGVTGDIGLYYYNKADIKHAEPLLLNAIKLIEGNLTPAIGNNLIADYMLMSCIRDQQGNKAEAESYAKKLVDLATKMRESKL